MNEVEGVEWFKQRLFSRSCASFYRSLQLFFAFLILERRCFKSWVEVTGYYSRFYFIQAFLNLTLCTWAEWNHCLFYYDGSKVRCLPQKDLSPTLKKSGSHETWWQVMEAIKHPNDYPVEHLDFILSRLVYSPLQRNTVNYDFEYLGGGFIELDWFDSGPEQLMTQLMSACGPRPDADITDIDRFFEGHDPEYCDEADFYDDDAQMLWCSIIGYLQLLKGLRFQQHFILTSNVAALAEAHLGNEYPNLMRGLLLSTVQCLDDGFEVDEFTQNRTQNPDRLSSFHGASNASNEAG